VVLVIHLLHLLRKVLREELVFLHQELLDTQQVVAVVHQQSVLMVQTTQVETVALEVMRIHLGHLQLQQALADIMLVVVVDNPLAQQELVAQVEEVLVQIVQMAQQVLQILVAVEVVVAVVLVEVVA
jgi:hypothetical protein